MPGRGLTHVSAQIVKSNVMMIYVPKTKRGYKPPLKSQKLFFIVIIRISSMNQNIVN